MALMHALGPISGSYKSPRIAVTVWDSDGATLDELTVLEYAASVVPDSIFDQEADNDPTIEELARNVYRVEVTYSATDFNPSTQPGPGERHVDFRYNFYAKPKYMYKALECVGVFDEDGSISFSTKDINVQTSGGVSRVVGMQVSPLPEVFSLECTIPNGMITDSFKRLVVSLGGCFNSTEFRGYSPGEIQLVRFSGGKRTDEDEQIGFGFGYQETQVDVDVDDITIPTLRGCDLYWTKDKEKYFEEIKSKFIVPQLAVVQRVWELADLNQLDIPEED